MRKLQHIFILLLSLIPICNLFSQGESLFNDAVVHEVHLTFDDANYWGALTSNYDNNYPDVPYMMANATIDGVSVDSI